MRRHRRAGILAAILSIAALAQASVAGAAPLTPEAIAAYRARIDGAGTARTALQGQATCLTGYLTELQARSAASEQALGEARRRERDLLAAVARGEEEQRGFEAQTRAERDNVANQQREYEHARAEHDEQERRVNTCGKFLGGFICHAGESAVKSFGWMNDAARGLGDAQRRLDNAQNGLNEVQGRLNATRASLSQVQGDLTKEQGTISQLEGFISRAKASSAELNIEIQKFNIRIEALAGALTDAAKPDPEDARPRTIARLAEELDAVTTEIPNFVANTRAALPEDAGARCMP